MDKKMTKTIRIENALHKHLKGLSEIAGVPLGVFIDQLLRDSVSGKVGCNG